MPPKTSPRTFGRSRRILLTGQFDRVYKLRRSAGDDLFVVYAAPNGAAQSRLGLSVGRRVGDAVRRNRVKRLLREAFRTSADLPAGFDFVVVPSKLSCNATLETVKSSLVTLALMACKRCEK